MCILQVVPTLSAGGAETFVVDLAVALKMIGCDVEVYLLAGVRGTRGRALAAKLSEHKIKLHGAEERNPRSLRNVPVLFRLLRDGGFRVVHSHLYSVELVLAVTNLFLRSGALHVRTIHNSNIFGTRSRIITRWLATRFNRSVCCGRQVYVSYTRLFGSSRVVAIRNGIPQPTKPPALPLCSGPKRDFRVVCVGAFRGGSLADCQKAQDIALQSFALAFRGDSACRLIFVGDGPLLSDAMHMAVELGIEAQVDFLGQSESCIPILESADLFFMPSRYEGLPISALEAVMMGLPVLASEIPELVALGNDASWRFRPVDHIAGFAKSLSEMREDQQTLQVAAGNCVAEYRRLYSIDECAAAYLEEYHACERELAPATKGGFDRERSQAKGLSPAEKDGWGAAQPKSDALESESGLPR